MKLRYKILVGIVAILATALLALGVTISYDSPCEPAAELSEDTETMQAIVYRCYGSPDVLSLENVEKPMPVGNEVLVRVRAASVNPLDWHYMRGSPYLMRLGTGIGKPEGTRMGVDFAGVVEAVGDDVSKFAPGDEVFGGRTGAFAEFVLVPEDRGLAAKPPEVTFEQAASTPIAALTALQALRDKGDLQPGQKVLINGASGGVGTFAVQIAKSLGANVTGVCSTRNVDMVRSIGADHVFDYKQEDYTASGQRYDLIVDMVGNHSISANRDSLTPDGKLVMVGGSKGDWIGPLIGPIKAILMSPFVDQELVLLLAQMNGEDLTTLGELMRDGDVVPIIDRQFSLHEVAEAIRYSEEGHARGKIMIVMD